MGFLPHNVTKVEIKSVGQHAVKMVGCCEWRRAAYLGRTRALERWNPIARVSRSRLTLAALHDGVKTRALEFRPEAVSRLRSLFRAGGGRR